MLPFTLTIFWFLIYFARDDLSNKAIAAFILIWSAILVGSLTLTLSPFIFIVGQALLDIVLILIVFRGDIRIN